MKLVQRTTTGTVHVSRGGGHTGLCGTAGARLFTGPASQITCKACLVNWWRIAGKAPTGDPDA